MMECQLHASMTAAHVEAACYELGGTVIIKAPLSMCSTFTGGEFSEHGSQQVFYAD
jgi:hypothetical protein